MLLLLLVVFWFEQLEQHYEKTCTCCFFGKNTQLQCYPYQSRSFSKA